VSVFRIVEGTGSSGFLCPPGHPNHTYHVEEVSPRGSVGAIGPLSMILGDDRASDGVRREAQRIIDEATLVQSEAWMRSVYDYFGNMYAPDSGSQNVSDLIHHQAGVAPPPERHAAVVTIRRYFPDHQPRMDLIEHPGRGYGSHPCDKCGARVQYEARFDSLALTTAHTKRASTKCAEGGGHVVTG
jgi:hypothetical protein